MSGTNETVKIGNLIAFHHKVFLSASVSEADTPLVARTWRRLLTACPPMPTEKHNFFLCLPAREIVSTPLVLPEVPPPPKPVSISPRGIRLPCGIREQATWAGDLLRVAHKLSDVTQHMRLDR
eukprot:1195195-Prorocentrum_minimum.AAC.2